MDLLIVFLVLLFIAWMRGNLAQPAGNCRPGAWVSSA
jgi:hypothetical protein